MEKQLETTINTETTPATELFEIAQQLISETEANEYGQKTQHYKVREVSGLTPVTGITPTCLDPYNNVINSPEKYSIRLRAGKAGIGKLSISTKPSVTFHPEPLQPHLPTMELNDAQTKIIVDELKELMHRGLLEPEGA